MDEPPFQFGLKAVFAATAACAVFFAGLSYAPDHMHILGLFILLALAIVFSPDV